jgi:type III secretion system-like peptide-binding chaperone
VAANLGIVKDKVQRILAENFSGVELGKAGNFTLRNESARLFINFMPQETRVIVNLVVPLLLKVAPTPELFHYIAIHGDDYIFGHLSAEETEDGIAVFFSHALLGDYLDDEELLASVRGLLGVGNDIDDELQAQFGGNKFHED